MPNEPDSRPADPIPQSGMALFPGANPTERRTALMTAIAPEGQSPPEDLTARVFRASYPGFDLHTLADQHLPKGTPCFTAPAIGEIARKISGRESVPAAAPDALHGPGGHRRP
jgi:hypothetical protein